MLRRLFTFLSKGTPAPIAGSMPAGKRVYAIGDVHGRLDLLNILLERIERDNEARPDADTCLLFLGDLVDRGPQSAQVIDRIIALKSARPNTRILTGNHEEMFLAALSGDLNALKVFTHVGGRETILSYGVTESDYRELGFEGLYEEFSRRVPKQHRAFIEAFEDVVVFGDYAFVHAGIRPNIPLEQQRTSDLRWIRKEFLEHTGSHAKIIVHGHTIFDAVQEYSSRISIDTGAYKSGKLSAMGFENEDRWILHT